MASKILNQSAGSWTGVTVSKITTSIEIYNYSTNAITHQQTPLSKAADTSSNVYNCQVTVQAVLSPLVTLHVPLLSHIQGLGAPMNINVTSTFNFESVQGLDQ